MRKPRRVTYAVIGALPQALGYAVVPVLIGRSGRRHGWVSSHPSLGNRAGVVPLAVGASFIGWAIASHYQAAPEESGITVVPEYLVTRGAYSISRNPLYVGGGLLWAGWAIFFGNARVALAGGGWLTLITTLGVPFEERLLRRKFGSAYDTYCRRVPRWLGLRPEVRASP